MTQLARKYGWIPDRPDRRDRRYAALPRTIMNLPVQTDLSPQCPPVYDQGELGSCTANAIAAAHEFDQLKQKLPDAFLPSRLFIYYNERRIEGTVASDSGAAIRDGIKTIAGQGVCPESAWPYDIAEFAAQPTQACYQAALENKALLYRRLPRSLTQMKACLAEGYPFLLGFTVYESFESEEVAQTGIVPMPSPGESVLGGHAVLAVGYDDQRKTFLVRNSWGPDWGKQGYFYLPYPYLADENLCDDFWTIRVVEARTN